MTTETKNEPSKKEYEILGEDYPSYDFSFKIIVIGNSGKKTIYFNNNLITMNYINK